jgi:UDP-2-acetamido-3-amino-2,3-dideoxy-glucuronate N-acetyltransferase
MKSVDVAPFIHASASVHETSVLKSGVKIWDFAQIRESAIIGEETIVGRGAYIDAQVKIGKNCKIQNSALIYAPAIIHNGVFIGPGAIFTNDQNPRAITSEGNLKSAKDWVSQGVEILSGASIGAGAICIAPVKVGAWAMVAAGSVVTKNVPNFALVAGVPARQIGWVGREGHRLVARHSKNSEFECPVSGTCYLETNGLLEERND